MWNNSIFDDSRSGGDRFLNRDSDTHMEITRDDLMNPRETTQWEKDLVKEESLYFSRQDADFNQEDTN
jgi:hypothetical protein